MSEPSVESSGRDAEAAQMIYHLDIVGLAQLPRCSRSSWSGAFQNELLDFGTGHPVAHPPAHKAALHVVAVMMVKDEQDIIALNLRWLRRTGFRRFVIIENGSKDGTAQAILAFRNAYPDCELVLIDDPILRHMQAEKATGAYRLVACLWPEARWVFLIDADEFLIAQNDLTILDKLAPDVSCIVLPKVIHFRKRSAHSLEDEGRKPFSSEMPIRSQLFFVPPKVAVRPSIDIVLHQGNHSAVRDDGAELKYTGGLGLGLCYREFQTRNFLHFRRKAINGTEALRAADLHTGQITPGRHWETWEALRAQQSEDEFRETYRQLCLRDVGGNLIEDPFPLESMIRDF